MDEIPDSERFVTRREAATRLRKSPGTLANWATKNLHLPVYKLPTGHARYKLADVQRLFESGEQRGAKL